MVRAVRHVMSASVFCDGQALPAASAKLPRTIRTSFSDGDRSRTSRAHAIA